MFKAFTIIFSLLICASAHSQDTTENISQALNSGSAKELIKYFNDVTELKINDKGANYSKIQAEAILKDFFAKNSAMNFSYIHKGASPEGLKYNIGQFTTKTDNYRVVILLKNVNDNYVIDTINFNKE